jgi:hypothetical protein
MIFFKVGGICGGGKTQRTLDYVAKTVREQKYNFIIAQPTIELLDQTFSRFQDISKDFKIFNLNSQTCDNVYNAVKDKLINTPSCRQTILLCSHKTIMESMSTLNMFKQNWHLIIDEIPQIDEHYSISIRKSRSVFPEFITFGNTEIGSYRQAHINERYRSLASSWTKSRDDVHALISPLLTTMLNPNTDNWIDYKKYISSRKGEFNIHSIIKPSVFEHWATTTIIGAHFENSIMAKLWSKMGVEWKQHPYIESDSEYHDRETSDRITIHYFSQRPWSKSLRDKVGPNNIKTLMKEINTMLDGQPTLWVANNDIKEHELRLQNATRISNVSHGNNSYLNYTNIVCFSALNDRPNHSRWFKTVWGIENMDLKLARGYETTYQCLMRTNLRIPNSSKKINVFVPDLHQASWLSMDVFPGAEIKYLEDWDGSQHMKTGTKVTRLAKEKMLHEIRCKMTSALWQNPHLSFENSIFQKIPLHSQTENWNQIKDLLSDSHKRITSSKEDNILISGAIFDPTACQDTKKGLGNILVCSSIWFDFDGGDLSPDHLSLILADTCHITFNSYNNGRDQQLRYRCFIPLSMPVTSDLYHALWDVFEKRIENYCKNYHLTSGIDRSKRTANSWFYLPCQAALGSEYNIWFEHWDLDLLCNPVNMLDGRLIIENDNTIQPIYITQSKGNDYSSALERWQAARFKTGNGNREFYYFGFELLKAGFSLQEIENILYQNVIYARHPSERKKQIPSIIQTLNRRRSYVEKTRQIRT